MGVKRPAHLRPVASKDELRELGEAILEAHARFILALHSRAQREEALEFTRERDHLRQRLTVVINGGRR